MARLLTFEPEGHTYELDGEELPSVSELTRFISREIYADVAQFTLDQAAERGTNVHRATEALDKFGDCEVSDDILPYVEAYVAFRGEHECEWQKIEWASYDPERKFAGTLDRVGMVDGHLTVLDVKTTYTIHKPSVTAQLSLYRMICNANGIEPEKLAVLQLKKDGTYKLVYIDYREDVANACLTLHRLMEKKRRKKKDAGE